MNSTTQTKTAFISSSPGFFVERGLRVFRLSGRDPSGMMDAISTNQLPEDGTTGEKTLLLDPKGRIQTDLLIVRDGEDLLAVVGEAGVEAARATISRYAPFSKVKVEETDLVVLTLRGLGGLPSSESPVQGLAPLESARLEIGGRAVVGVGREYEGGCEVITPAESAEAVANALAEKSVTPLKEDSYETSRIASAIPRFGADFTPENFPGELGESFLGGHVSFDKGCYPGQETVARMHYRGQPNKRLHRFTVEGEARPGAQILQNDKNVGYLTSVAPLEVGGETYALGYLKRRADTDGKFLAGGAPLKVSRLEHP